MSGSRQIVTGDGVSLSVEVAGEGPLVVLIHGWPELGLSWRHQVPALVKAGFRVAVPDMRGYGASDKPEPASAYRLDLIADDIRAVARAQGAARFAVIGHDWGAPAAWRAALRFPDAVAGVFALSVPHSGPPPVPLMNIIDALYPERFFYIRYFQNEGVAEAKFAAADMRAALKKIFWSASYEGVAHGGVRTVPRDATLLESFGDPPPGPLPFMSDAELEAYAAAFRAGGMKGPLNWYRNFPANAEDARAYGDNIIRQPAGFLAGDREVVLAMLPGQLEAMRKLTADLRVETIVPGAGHWIQQEKPAETNVALISFLDGIRDRL